MQPFRYCGEWIFARPCDIVVERFIGWRRAGRRRLFQPCAVLRAGIHSIMLDGLDAVWDFINAVQPNMPRAVVNQGMKGEFIEEQPFAQDLQDFIDESAADFIPVRGHYAQVSEPPNSWGESASIYLPMRMRGGEVRWLPSLVVGDYPRLITAQSMSESKAFDMQSPVLISSIVCADEQGQGDIRPHRSLKRTEPATIISSIADMHHQLCDSDYESLPCNEVSSSGLRFAEAEDIEHSRAERLFISLH